MEQRTDEWYEARLGCVTASRLSDVMAKTKSGYGASRENYKSQLIVERMTGESQSGFTNAAMEWGIEHEEQARILYEFTFDAAVTEVGFIKHAMIKNFGASPDGFVGDDGLIEIKCPNTKTHLDYILTGKIPPKYILQMHAQMMCTGRFWCDFVSFDPRVPENMQMFVKRVPLDVELAVEIGNEVDQFNNELIEQEDKLLQFKVRHG